MISVDGSLHVHGHFNCCLEFEERRSELENFLKKQRSSEVNALSLHSLWNFGLEDKCSKFDSLVTKQGPPGKRETSLHSLLTMPFQVSTQRPVRLCDGTSQFVCLL